ncbi:hypothetical protein RJ639_042653 [Escallonia herrerae]|uniref:ABC transporter domain-containing protein n=1 Tax=Escallonia herrerae TaxID=1293975 RepID=A0AA89BB73_9ASTE|nr:hypothetical protein RJ639_042653 [Escallonia herrerae]
MEIEGAAFASASGGGGGDDVEKGGGDDVEKGEAESIGGNEGVAYLVWEDLTVVLPNFGHGPTKRLLHGLSGYAEPGRIMAIMGPSGSGKSTLLDALAGRLSTNVVMTGNILLNGNKRRLNYGVVAYVTQDDVLLGTLTVRETITYSAHLRLPTTLTKEEVQEIVEGTIMEMGLEYCADRLRPRLLFLDEPTSGLDRASAFFEVQALKSVARDGRTVIFLFTSLAIALLLQFFAEAGFACPSKRNPSDHFLRCINSDFDIVTATFKGSQRIRVFYRERLNGYYGVDVFILSNFLSSFPYLVAVAFTTGTITYYMVKFGQRVSHYVYFCLNLFGCISVVESCMMIVASLVPNFLMGIITGAGVLGIMMLTAGFFRLLPDLPKPVWRYPISYISYRSWSLQGAYKNDMIGLVFDPLVPGNPKLKGEDIIKNMFRMSLDHSKCFGGSCFIHFKESRKFSLMCIIVEQFEDAVASSNHALVNSTIDRKFKLAPLHENVLVIGSRANEISGTMSGLYQLSFGTGCGKECVRALCYYYYSIAVDLNSNPPSDKADNEKYKSKIMAANYQIFVCLGRVDGVEMEMLGARELLIVNMEIEVAEAAVAADIGSAAGGDLEKGVISDGAAYLAWEELTVVLPNFGNGPTRRLLNGLTGYAQPGRIMAIMGPSGSGKSTLLDSLAGRLSGNAVMTGNVLLNGRKKRLDYGVAYVTQEDILLGTLTVKETITYSAQLRLPGNMTRDQVNEIVEGTIMEMGLQDCADQLIGNWHLRGISGGEKKRLGIALEILTRPSLLFLDEPTSGLDSASAFFVVQALRNVCCDGRTIISSIHQPSSEVFALFNDLFLLSGGETVYFGEAKKALEIKASLLIRGFHVQVKEIPLITSFDVSTQTSTVSMPLLWDLIEYLYVSSCSVTTTIVISLNSVQNIQSSSGPFFNLATAEIKARLVERYKSSEYAKEARCKVREILITEGLHMETTIGSQATWSKQLCTLTRRSFVNMCRDFGYYWLRIVVYLAVSFCVGTVFFDIGTSYNAILARGACGGFISGFMTFMSIGGFPSFIEEMKIFHRERLNGHYGVGVFALSNFLSSFPFLAVMSLGTATVTYNMVKFRPGFSHFIYTYLDLLSSIAVVESCMMVVASLVPNFLMGIIAGAGVIGIMMMTAGFFRLFPDLPKPFWRYPFSYINYMAWALQGAYKNDMIGIEFDPAQPGDPKLKGEVILETVLGISLRHSKWWDLAVVISILLFYRLLFFTILKFKERASPVFRKLYAKRTLQHLRKRPSFRKTPPFPSKRHQIVHSLSSQEGLNSPIH